MHIHEHTVGVDLCNTIAKVNDEIAKTLGIGNWCPTEYGLQTLIEDIDKWFRQHPQVFSEAKPVEHSRETLHRLVAMGCRLVYVSARPEWARDITTRWLIKHGFPKAPLILTKDKASVAKMLSLDLMIEDAPSEIDALKEVCPVYGLAQSYNNERGTWASLNQVLRKEGLNWLTKEISPIRFPHSNSLKTAHMRSC